MRKSFVLILLLLAPVLSGSLSAQEEKTGYEIGIYAGQQDWKARTFQIGPPQAAVPINLGFQYKDRPVYGVRGNFLSQGHWAGEVSYSYQTNTVTLTRQSFAPTSLSGSIHHVFYNEVFYPARYRNTVTPYITGGLGMALYHLTDTARALAADPRIYGLGNLRSLDKRVALNYGAGVKVNATSNFGIRVDFRHIFSDVPSYGLPKESPLPTQVVLPIQGKLQNYEFSLGIYFRKLSEGFK
jgi:opacity protein-like surface antigen